MKGDALSSNTKLALALAAAALGVVVLIGGAVVGVVAIAIIADGADAPTAARSASTQPAAAAVIVNGTRLGDGALADFERVYGVRPTPGRYWYDASSGLWGVVGRPSAGFLLAGHELGRLASDASNGDTGVFMNGRELPYAEWMSFSAILGAPLQRGRYWLDGQGNAGVEGSAKAQVNLYAAYRARIAAAGGGWSPDGGGGGGGGDNFWSSRFSAGNSDRGGTRGYVSVPGYGPVGYGF